MNKEYWAHTENDIQKIPHILKDHLRCVGELAEKFICEANAELCEQAKWAGFLHDLGKYRDEFQEYLIGQRESSNETHHAVYGAALAWERKGFLIANAIAGHHAGLYDNYKLKDGSLFTEYQTNARLPQIIERYEKELGKVIEKLEIPKFINNSLKIEFATRMIFSCLVDADYLDTEKHYRNGEERKVTEFMPIELLEKLEAERVKKVTKAKENNADENLIEIRNQIFENCLQKSENPKGFFSLTVPTGGGKTLSAMAFALKHAEVHKLRRVIVVIPYLSIIEQNAKEYREILGEDFVIENHSAVKIKSEEAEETAKSEDPLGPSCGPA